MSAISLEQMAAVVASGLVNNGQYIKCYQLDADAVARDAVAIAQKICNAVDDLNRRAISKLFSDSKAQL